MGMVKTAGTVAVASAGTLAVLAGLESMDSDTIRSCGNKVNGAVQKIGDGLKGSEFAKDIESKLAETKYGPKVLDLASKAQGAVSSGFDKFFSTLADSKDEAEATGQSMSGVMFGKLTDLVSSGADFLAEHVPSGKDLGESVANKLLASREDEPSAQDAGDDFVYGG